MNPTAHLTDDQLARYRRCELLPDELVATEVHFAVCDRCRNAAIEIHSPDERLILEMDETSHLTYDEIERWIDGQVDETDRELIGLHTEQCAICRKEIADLIAVRESLATASGEESRRNANVIARQSLAAAAVVAIVIASAWILLRQQHSTTPVIRVVTPAPRTDELPSPLRERVAAVLTGGGLKKPPIIDTLNRPTALRSVASDAGGFNVVAPVGTVVLDTRPTLRWSPLPGAHSYSVAVMDLTSSAIVASGLTEGESWRPEGTLEREHTYSWQVTARRGNATMTAPSASQPQALFSVASAAQAAEFGSVRTRDPLPIGIAFAEEGLLDDAERELQLASASGNRRAADLLANVRSWRATSRPR